MNVAFAILGDDRMHNLARDYALKIHARYDTGLIASMLPPHITLKQPFAVKNLAELARVERYFRRFVGKISPFSVELSGLNLFDTGVLFWDVGHTRKLMGLHLDLLTGLKKRFFITPVLHEGGDTYHFHCTISYGGASPAVYKKILRKYGREDIRYRFTVSKLAVFVSPDDNCRPGTYFTHKIISLNEAA